LLSACEWIFGSRPLPEVASALAACGYDAIEVVGEPTRRDLSQLREILEGAELRVTGLTAQTAGFDQRDLARPDRHLSRQAVSYYRACVELAVRLDAPTIGLHPSGEGRVAPIRGYRREWEFAVEAVREIAHYAGEHGRLIAVEPLNRYEAFLVNRVDQALAFVEDVDVPGVGIVADFFHMNIEETDLGAALERGRDRLLEVHLADSNRRGLGQGHLPVGDLLSAVSSFEGPFVMEFTATSDAELDGYLQASAVIARHGL
jgi:sugar phosphate isomerase/epimerase